jgi:hypothetical protein
MFHEQIRECLRYANECEQRANVSLNSGRRQELLDMQLRWLSMARSYEFSEQLEVLSNIEARNKEARQIIEEATA